MPRRFTLREAEALLATIEPWVREAASLKSEYDQAAAAFDAVLQRIMFLGGVALDRDEVLVERKRREHAGERLKSTMEKIQETGCVVKDLDIGLVDFPTLFRGEEVCLCWKLGEDHIGWWHGTTEGFAGRKVINQDFIDHHRGDPSE
jgi:hypothetical protein